MVPRAENPSPLAEKPLGKNPLGAEKPKNLSEKPFTIVEDYAEVSEMDFERILNVKMSLRYLI